MQSGVVAKRSKKLLSAENLVLLIMPIKKPP
jgi:hypothetical protein